jgi:integrase
VRLYQRNGVWQVDLRIDGAEVRRSLKTGNKAEATRRAQQLLTANVQAPATRSLYDCLIDWLHLEQRSPQEISTIRRIRELIPDRPIAQLSQPILSKALDGLQEATFNRYLTVIMAAARLSAQTHKTAIPLLKKKKVKETRLRFLSFEEWERLSAALSDDLRPLVEFSLATGLRRSNVLNLRWSEVNLQARTVLVYSDEAKGRKRLVLPLNDWAMEVLDGVRQRDPTWVFASPAGGPYSTPKTGWMSALKRAGIEDFRWHDLRHTWASWAAQSGMPLMVIKELGGWSDIAMVMRYAHLTDSHLRSSANLVKKPNGTHKPRTRKKEGF